MPHMYNMQSLTDVRDSLPVSRNWTHLSLETSKSLRQRFKCSSPQQPKTFSPVTKALEHVTVCEGGVSPSTKNICVPIYDYRWKIYKMWHVLPSFIFWNVQNHLYWIKNWKSILKDKQIHQFTIVPKIYNDNRFTSSWQSFFNQPASTLTDGSARCSKRRPRSRAWQVIQLVIFVIPFPTPQSTLSPIIMEVENYPKWI